MDKPKLPNKYIIPKDRIPKPWSQGPYDCCVAASITKVLEVINYVKTGTYTMMSKGYTYGRHSRPTKTQGGMDYSYTIPRLIDAGTVPEYMFPVMDEIPDIMEKVINAPNIEELDKEAINNRVLSVTEIRGNVYFRDNVKDLLYHHQLPLIGNMVGKRHCTVIVGWDGDDLLYVDHDGRDDIFRGRFNGAYFLEPFPESDTTIEGEDDMTQNNKKTLPFTDVATDRWSYKYIEKLYNLGVMNGTSETNFSPTKTLTREEMAAILCRALFGME